jgi:glycosyltransferase involved in cell wall biosynthesis
MTQSGNSPEGRANAAAYVNAQAPVGVVYLARDLNVGGAERVLVNYVNHSRAFQPVVVLRRREGGLLGDLDDGVPLFDLTSSGGSPRESVERTPGVEGAPGVTASRAPSAPDTAPTGVTIRSLVQLVQECYRLRRIVRHTGCRMVSSFLMRSHIVGILTKRWLDRELYLVVNVHEHMSESAEHLYPARLDRMLMRLVTRRWFPLADRIVVVAESVRSDLVETFGVPLDRIALIRNPIDTERIRSLSTDEIPDAESVDGILLVATGRLVRLKGFDLLIRAVSMLPARQDIRLQIVGDGPERASLQGLVRELGLDDRVTFLGARANPWKYMARATVVVHASRTEAFPNVLGEALALGVPVLAAECSAGIREYLDDGRCGVLVPPDDATALAEALARLLEDDDLRCRLSELGPRRMEEFELKRVVRDYERLLTDVRAPDDLRPEGV